MAEQPAAQGGEKTGAWKRPLFRWLVFLELLVLFGFVYVSIGELLILQTNNTNKEIHGGDQLHNIRLATVTRPDLHPDFRQSFVKPLTDILPHRTDGA